MTSPQDASTEVFASQVTGAINTRHAPTAAVDLITQAFTWRTIDEELMALSYDSAGDLATVRDPDAMQTLEFNLGENSVVVEIDQSGVLRGQVTGIEGVIVLRTLESERETPLDRFGGFVFDGISAGPAQLICGGLVTETFVLPEAA